MCSYSYPLPRRAITTRRFRIYRSVASNDERLAGMSAGRGKSTFLPLRALLFTALSFQRLNNSPHASVRPARSDRLRLFLGLGRCLLCLVRWSRWALFSKDNLSFPRNVRTGDLLSKLLKIEFDIGDSLFQGFVFVCHMFDLDWLTIGKWIRSWPETGGRGYDRKCVRY